MGVNIVDELIELRSNFISPCGPDLLVNYIFAVNPFLITSVWAAFHRLAVISVLDVLINMPVVICYPLIYHCYSLSR